MKMEMRAGGWYGVDEVGLFGLRFWSIGLYLIHTDIADQQF